tara:strand:- start:3089 stop:3913 length:825 start_codon:yes stop_codon:yes gene_type:complete
MKRKLVKQGTATLMISLPSKWLRSFNLNKGDEINLEEQENQLVLTTDKTFEIAKEKLDLKNLKTANRSILTKYIKGIDEIEITYSDPKIITKIQTEILPGLIGFEIVDQNANYCKLKEISKPEEKEFENILRRLFLILNHMFTDLITLQKQNKPTSSLKHLDLNINKFSAFCLRILNKSKRNHSLYSIIQNLEWLGDVLKHLSTSKLTPSEIKILEKIHSFFKDFEKEFYHKEAPLETLSKNKDLLLKPLTPSKSSNFLASAIYTLIRLFNNLA